MRKLYLMQRQQRGCNPLQKGVTEQNSKRNKPKRNWLKQQKYDYSLPRGRYFNHKKEYEGNNLRRKGGKQRVDMRE